MHKRITLALAALTLSTFGLTTGARAQSQLGVGIGYDVDVEAAFAGAHFRFAPASLPFQISPGFDYYFVDGVTALQFDINALYDIGVDNQAFTPYIGAGLGIGYVEAEGLGDNDSNTDTGLNLIFGAKFGFNSLQPYVQAKGTLGGGITGVGVSGGVLFSF